MALLSMAALASCARARPDAGGWADLQASVAAARVVTARVVQQPLRSRACGDRFVEHRLLHTTRARTADVLPFDTNGAGLAVGDLDADGRPEIVLGDLRHAASVLWNRGAFAFTRTELVDPESGNEETNTRAVAIVDVDRDGRPDIVTTHTSGGLAVWHNDGSRRFTAGTIDDVSLPAYSMLWDDLDGDGGLDLVTASYDASLEREQGSSFLLGRGGGVVAYRRNGKTWRATRIVRAAQTLALTLFDTDGDGRRELVVGNDFGVPDRVYRIDRDASFHEVHPFARLTRNTMAFAVGDVGADGRLDLFASDMKPSYAGTAEIAAWMPLLGPRFERILPADRQRPENALQLQRRRGRFADAAYSRGVDATGWSWSAQFGDLDLDGLEDLYVVNGMIDHELLGHLRGDELVERNQAFSVDARGRFRRRDWGLGSAASGRSMLLYDIDGDGRLDAVVNNLGAPAVVFENRLCGAGTPMEVRLVWDGQANRAAFGALVLAELDHGGLVRAVSPGGGYLSAGDGSVHLGIPRGRRVLRLVVLWPDGAVTFSDHPAAQRLLTVLREVEP